MVRIARKASGSGIYHVVMRGAGRQLLFEDNCDRRRFLEFTYDSFADHEVKLLCYCLMPNHVHLIAQGELSALSAAMHLLGTRYALRFNKKSDHCGPVFEDRFYSDPIEADAHFFAALRYVLLNPEHAGICPASEYPGVRTRNTSASPRTATPRSCPIFWGTARLCRRSFPKATLPSIDSRARRAWTTSRRLASPARPSGA